jgi:hypothetical protein
VARHFKTKKSKACHFHILPIQNRSYVINNHARLPAYGKSHVSITKSLLESDYQTQKTAASLFCESFLNANFIIFSIANYAGWAITCWPFGGEDATPKNVRAKTWIL